MEAPPVQYTKTSNGYSIAHMVSGSGPVVVYMPQLYQHSQRLWAGGGFARTLRSLAQRFRVVQYDSRGQGMSQRGLPEPHSFAEYELDLAAVVAAVGTERVALHAVGPFAHVGIRYAAAYPDRVAALVLQGTTVESNLATLYTTEMLELGRSNWDLFLLMNARMGFQQSDSQQW
jgi:pimeloyl-ACP methyl ester carboxylesterase